VPRSWNGDYPSLTVLPVGQLYLTWEFFYSSIQYEDVRFTFSSDGGVSFSAPVNPSDGPSHDWEDRATVTTNAQGQVFVAWSDSRNDTSGSNSDVYFSSGALTAIEDQTPLHSPSPQCNVFPNPSREKVWVDYALTYPGRTRILVSDAAGRSVATLTDEQEYSGRHVRVWNGCDAQGNIVGSGVYFIRVQTPDGATTRKVRF
jgi:hypothetical protein